MQSALSHRAAPALVVRSVVDVCTFVDDLPGDAAGELAFQGPSALEGAVFVENGRICWAAARGLARRLSDLLAASAKMSSAAMEALYGACRLQRAPLGEYLVNAGVVSAEDLRAALLEHTGESLRVLCAPGARAEWTLRRPGRYCSRFTFRTTDLLARACPEPYRALAKAAAAELAETFAVDGEWGVAFLRTAGAAAPDPIAARGALPDKTEALLRLGRWAASSLDVASPAHGDGALVAAVLDDGALVTWRSGPAIVAGWTGPNGPARLLNRRASSRRKGGAHGGV